MILARTIHQSTRIFMIFARKINKIPEFYMIFARKMPEFYIINARIISFPIWGGGGTCPPSPTPMARRQNLIDPAMRYRIANRRVCWLVLKLNS